MMESLGTKSRRADTATPAPGETFTSDELAAILREASRRQESRDVATLDAALETARELGIDESNVHAAVAALREKKARREELHARTVRERRKLGGTLWSAAMVIAIVTVAAGWPTAQLVLFGFSIAAIAQGFRWLRSEIRERTE